MMTLIDRIKKHEGLRLFVYDDATGKPIKQGTTVQGHPTIGYGRLLDDRNGITLEMAEAMLTEDLGRVKRQVAVSLPWADRLTESRREVLYEMCFQLGLRGLLGFRLTLNHIKNGDYDKAAREMLNSRWARQTPSRAKALAEVMRNG